MDYIIQLNFYKYLNYFDYTNLLCSCKYYYKNFSNDNIYKEYLAKKFSNNFTNIVKPFIISYFDCFLRIINFESLVINMGYELWEEDVYYIFWNLKYKHLLHC